MAKSIPFYHKNHVDMLKDFGVKIIPAQLTSTNDTYKQGTNACFIPKTKEVLLNTEKIAVAAGSIEE